MQAHTGRSFASNNFVFALKREFFLWYVNYFNLAQIFFKLFHGLASQQILTPRRITLRRVEYLHEKRIVQQNHLSLLNRGPGGLDSRN